jgi:uncharacterized protein (DUF58 family)
VEKYIPPRKGLDHVLRVVREALYFKPKGKSTNIAGAMQFMDGVTPRRVVAFVISDFFAKNFKRELKVANKRHDVVAITITDPRELTLPNAGIVELTDAESGALIMVDTANAKLRARYAERSRHMFEARKRLFGSIDVDHIELMTDRPYIDEFVKFFKMRKRRI